MRRVAVAALAAIAFAGCRPYDNYAPVVDQRGLVPAAQFARYGREQAEAVAIGRSLSEWKLTEDEAGFTGQTDHAACFAKRFPDVATVDADPLGHRLTVKFKSGWRVGIIPIPDGIQPDATPGLPPLGPASCP
jgi:hypothetical protein